MPKRYVCVSSLCRREVEIEIPPARPDSGTFHPICNCGSEMKKVYSKPSFLKLSMAEAMRRFGELVGEELSGNK